MEINWDRVETLTRKGNPSPSKRIVKTNEEWQRQLTPSQYHVMRQKGTERPFTGELCTTFEPGKYGCGCCGTLLFDSETKFESGTGWPSFTQPVEENVIKYIGDHSLGMTRVEVLCNICDAHLGHVFPDGPEPTGLRYCINSVSLVKVK